MLSIEKITYHYGSDLFNIVKFYLTVICSYSPFSSSFFKKNSGKGLQVLAYPMGVTKGVVSLNADRNVH